MIIQVANAYHPGIEEDEINARRDLDELNVELERRNNLATLASWAYASNITDYNLEKKNEVDADNAAFAKVIISENLSELYTKHS